MLRLGTVKLTRKEVAEFLGVTVLTVYRYQFEKYAPYGITLEPVRVGKRKIFYTEEGVEEWLRQVDRRRERLKKMQSTRRVIAC